MEYETNQAAAPETEQATAPEAVPNPPKKVRRVGTFTFGLVLVAAGVLMILKILVPSFDLYTVVKFAPAVLIVLGIEVLIYSARPNVKIKYDFWGMLACGFILAVVGGSTLFPLLWAYYGPAHDQQMSQFQTQLEKETRQALDEVPGIENLVYSASFNVWWSEAGMDSSITDLHQVEDRVETQAHFTLTRRCGSAEEFAAVCKSMMDACAKANIPIQQYYFTTHNNTYEEGPLVDYSLNAADGWLSRADVETLADCVTVSWYADGTYFDSEQEYLDWQAEREAERIAATAETAMEAPYEEEEEQIYREGYTIGYEEGYAAAREELTNGAGD